MREKKISLNHLPLSRSFPLPLPPSTLSLSHYQVDQLTSQLKEKADWCSELLLSSEQLHRDLKERDEEIDKLESRIRELEQALLASAESLEKVREGKGGREGGRTSEREGKEDERCAETRAEKNKLNK